MKKFNRIIVALDNTDFDEKLLHYFSQFTEITMPKKVYFVYVDENLEVPPNVTITYKDENGNPIPKDELLNRLLTQRVKEFFPNHHDVNFEVNILEGNPLQQLLHWTKVKDVELLVLGNKKAAVGSGVVAKQIARNTDCAVLFVPETSQEDLHNILVPIDFSKHSELAMKGAIELAHEVKNGEITAFNVFNVPMTGYPMVNMNHERFVRNMAAFKQDAFDEYMTKFDFNGTKISTEYVENDRNNVAKHINDFAHKEGFDLIVIGAKGHSLLDRILIGSVTEKLVTYDKKIPLLILRNQN